MVCSPVPKIHVACGQVCVSVAEVGGCTSLVYMNKILLKLTFREAEKAEKVED